MNALRWMLICVAAAVLTVGLIVTAEAQECPADETATLTWEAPTERSDGSPLTDLAGFNLYWGTESGMYTHAVTLEDPGVLTHVVGGLLRGTAYYFVATAVDSAGLESSFSNEASKVTDGTCAAPNPPQLTVDPGHRTAYMLVQSRDRIALLPVGTVAPDAECDGSQSVHGRYVVARETVTFAGSVQPEVVVAACVSF